MNDLLVSSLHLRPSVPSKIAYSICPIGIAVSSLWVSDLTVCVVPTYDEMKQGHGVRTVLSPTK